MSTAKYNKLPLFNLSNNLTLYLRVNAANKK